MANSNLPINPKTGQVEQFGGGGFMKTATRQATEARAAADQHGKDDAGQEFVGMKAVTSRMSAAAKAYFQPLSDLVENNLDTMFGLKQVLPLLNEAITLAPLSPLDKTDQANAIRGLKLLLSFVQRQTQFQTRLAAATKNAVKAKVTSMKQGFIDKLQTSDSMLKRFVGKQLNQSFGNDAQARQKEMLEARASTLETLDTPEEQRSQRPRRVSQPEEQEDGSHVGKGGGAGSTKVLGEILGVDKGILSQVTKLASTTDDLKTQDKQLAEESEEAAEQRAEEIERQEENDDRPQRISNKTGEPAEKKKGKGIVDNILKMFGEGSGLSGIMKTVMPALGLLGKGASVLGAAFVGWEIGSAISKFIGLGDSSAALAALLDTKTQSIDSTLDEIDHGMRETLKHMTGLGSTEEDKARQDEKDLAWKRMGTNKKFAKKEDISLEAARKYNQKWSADKIKAGTTAAVTDTSALAAPTDTTPTPITASQEFGTDITGGQAAPTGTTPTPAAAPQEFGTDVVGGQATPTGTTPTPAAAPQEFGTTVAGGQAGPADTQPASISPERKTQKAIENALASGPPKATPSRVSGDTEFSYATYAETLGKRESGNNYKAINRLGYVGKYQFGVRSLEDAGLIKPGTFKSYGQSKKTVQDPNNWTNPGGLEAFYNDHNAQETAMRKYTERNKKALTRLKVISPITAPEKVAGYLAAAHLVGAGNVANQGLTGKDANQTSAASYFALASGAQLRTQTQMAMATPTPAFGAPTPSPNRNAGNLAQASRQVASASPHITVNAPRVSQVAPQAAPLPGFIPIIAENREITLNAILGINAPGMG